jgi:hypothetical protein
VLPPLNVNVESTDRHPFHALSKAYTVAANFIRNVGEWALFGLTLTRVRTENNGVVRGAGELGPTSPGGAADHHRPGERRYGHDQCRRGRSSSVYCLRLAV